MTYNFLMEKKSVVWKILISLFLLFHLFGVFLTPNPRSFLANAVSPIYRPYMNFLGLQHTWGFFAPEPLSPPLYIDYVLDQKNAPAITGRFPSEKSPFFFRDRQNRRMSLAKFLASSEDHLRNMFMNHLCNQYPETTQARLWRVTITQASLEMVRSGKKKITDPVDSKIEILGTFYCLEKNNE